MKLILIVCLFFIVTQDSTKYTPLHLDPHDFKPMMKEIEGVTKMNSDMKVVSTDSSLSLSSYAWEWAPYINALKQKLYGVWFTPPQYHILGLVHGYTVLELTINRQGQLLNMKVIEHEGHSMLRKASIDAINAVFPFRPLPESFPDPYLIITAKLIYPNLKKDNEQ